MTLTRTQTFIYYVSSVLISFALVIAFSLSITGFASVGIYPEGYDRTDENDRGWFLYNTDAGETIEDSVVLTNVSNNDIIVELLGRDAEITSDGAFTVISSQLQNSKAGAWINFASDNYSIPAAQSITVPFTVTIPEGTESGEYGAGVAVQQLGSGGDVKQGNVTIKTRNAVRMYITVGNDLTLDANVGNLNIIDPQDENFDIERAKRSNLGRDNVVIQYQAQNTGNIYSKLTGEYKVTFPDGSILEQRITKDLATDQPIKDFYIETGREYMPGTTNVELRYTIVPLNDQEVAIDTEEILLTDSLEITQDEIDAFAPSRAPIIVNQNGDSGTVSEQPTIIPDEDEDDSDEVSLEKNLLYLAIFFLAIIMVLQLVNIFTKKSK